MNQNSDGKMALMDHIQDLRRHVVHILIWILAASGLCLVFMNPIFSFLKHPYDTFLLESKAQNISQNLTSIGIFEVMTVNFKICFLIGFMISLPMILYEIWKFISPGLYPYEKKIAIISVFSSIFLFYFGILFGFFAIIPFFFKNALMWASQYATVMITYESYFNSLITMVLIFAIVFEIPVVFSLLGLAGILPSETLVKNRKIAFLLCFIIGALLAPPDVASLCLVAVPMYLMVEISIQLIRQIEKKRSGSRGQAAG